MIVTDLLRLELVDSSAQVAELLLQLAGLAPFPVDVRIQSVSIWESQQ